MDIDELEYISIVAQAMFWVVAAIGAATVFAMWILPQAFPWH